MLKVCILCWCIFYLRAKSRSLDFFFFFCYVWCISYDDVHVCCRFWYFVAPKRVKEELPFQSISEILFSSHALCVLCKIGGKTRIQKRSASHVGWIVMPLANYLLIIIVYTTDGSWGPVSSFAPYSTGRVVAQKMALGLLWPAVTSLLCSRTNGVWNVIFLAIWMDYDPSNVWNTWKFFTRKNWAKNNVYTLYARFKVQHRLVYYFHVMCPGRTIYSSIYDCSES